MRIAIFSECYTPVANGVVTSIQTLRETLRAQGHTVVIFAPGTPLPDDDADIYRLPELPFPNHPYHFARPFPRLKVDFSALDIQLVHCQHPFTVGRLGAETARKYGLPMVYTAHSLYDMMAANMKSPIMRRMGQKAMRGVVKRFCGKAECVITPSKYTRDALRAVGVRARFAVVPSGVLGPFILPGGRERVRAALGIAPEMPLILCVGRLGPEKRVDLLLRAIAVLTHNCGQPPPDFRLALVGDGQCRCELKTLADTLRIRDRVFFVGAQPHATIGDWYAAADIFALSSPSETQGLVLVEAMAAGLPCVTVDYGGPREVVANGETGLRVPFDPTAFARALDFLLRDPEARHRLGEKGRLRARAYSPEAMASGVLAVYENVLRVPRLPFNSSRPPRAVSLL
jgi:glycosyltransferase involved in cell wall biosynthesis